MRRTYYSPWGWVTFASILAFPTINFIWNGFRDGGNPFIAILYLVVGYILAYGAYRLFNSANVVPNITVGDGSFLLRRYKYEVVTEISNIKQLERTKHGIWRLIFREPVYDSKNIEIKDLDLQEFSGWRKTKWREVLGPGIEIVT